MPIFLAILLCAVILALLIYRYDLYEKEPWPLLILTLVAGGVSGWLAGWVEDAILRSLGDRGRELFTQALLASVTEELFKLAVVLGVAWVFYHEFNDPLDGLIYGAFAGLGAAVEESYFYVQLSEDVGTALIGTELIRLLLHIFLGGLAGFGVGLARFRIPYWPGIFLAALSADLLLHFGWDYFCGIPAQSAESALGQRFLAIGLMLGALLCFGVSVFWGSRWSRKILAPKSSKRLWGWPFSLIFGSEQK